MRRAGERERNKDDRIRDEISARMAFKNLSPEEQIKERARQEALTRIQRNGITVDDLKQNYDEGFTEGHKQGCEVTFETIFAAVCLALNELHGFGGTRCRRVLNAVHEKVYYCISRKDIIQEVYDRMGLEINFRNEPGEIVEMKEEA